MAVGPDPAPPSLLDAETDRERRIREHVRRVLRALLARQRGRQRDRDAPPPQA